MSGGWHEEVEPGEGDHVHGQLAEVCVELTGEPEVGSGKLCLNFCPLHISPILFLSGKLYNPVKLLVSEFNLLKYHISIKFITTNGI